MIIDILIFMFCKECGAEIPDDSKHCKECGANLSEESSNEVNAPKKKGILEGSNKKYIIGCCIGLIVIFLLVGVATLSNDVSKTNSSSTSKNNEMSEQDFKANCSHIDYAQLEKDPNKYKDQNAVFSGKIFQIQEKNGEGMILLSTGDYNTNLVYVDYSGANDFVENDQVTIYGVLKGDKSYNTRIGSNNLPYMEGKYIEKS